MRHAVIAVALLALAAAANAQGVASLFPYSSCQKQLKNSVYSASYIGSLGGPKKPICWKVSVSQAQCTDPAPEETGQFSINCCNEDLHKIELDVKPSCGAGFKGYATVKSGSTTKKVAAYIQRPPNAVGGVATLYANNLGLDKATADGAEICFVVESGTCDTLPELAATDEYGAWKVALQNKPHGCCPVSTGHGCDVCFEWTVLDMDQPSAIVPYFDVKANCDRANKTAVDVFTAEGLLSTSEPTDGYKPFVTTTCAANKAKTCIWAYDADVVGPVVQGLTAAELLPPFEIGANGCPAIMSGLVAKVEATSKYPECTIAVEEECPVDTSFPYCECQSTAYNTPFSVSPVATKVGERTFCVDIVTNDVDPAIACKNTKNGEETSTTLWKAEFWFNYKLRYDLDKIWLSSKTDAFAKKELPSIWGPAKDNTLRISKLAMSVEDVNSAEPQICFLMKQGKKFSDLARGDGELIWSSLFDPENVCCPTYSSFPYAPLASP